MTIQVPIGDRFFVADLISVCRISFRQQTNVARDKNRRMKSFFFRRKKKKTLHILRRGDSSGWKNYKDRSVRLDQNQSENGKYKSKCRFREDLSVCKEQGQSFPRDWHLSAS